MRKLLLLSLLILLPYQYAFGAAATMYVTVAGAGNKDGTDWDNAFGLGEWETDAEGSTEAGDIYYVAGGTYTLTNDFNVTNSGTMASPISIIGVKSGTTATPPTFSDWAFTTDRPLVAAAANDFRWDDYIIFRNIQCTTTDPYGFRCDLSGVYENCKSNNSSGTANYGAFYSTNIVEVGIVRYINCEGQAANGYAIDTNGRARVSGCYLHDSSIAFESPSFDYSIIESSVIDTCTTGLSITDASGLFIKNNVFYNITTAISASTAESCVIVNNIFDECTTPASWTTEQKSNIFDYNSWDGDASSNSNITEGNNSIDSDITLTDPANGDFTLGSGSACIDAGLQLNTNTGATGDYKWNIGADQDDVSGSANDVFGWVD